MIYKTPICDGHVHFFPEKLYYAVHDWFSSKGWDIPYRWPAEQKKGFLKNNGITRAFLLAYAHKPDMSMEVNRWVHYFVSVDEFFYPFGCVHPDDAELKHVLKTSLDDFNFCGIKLQLYLLGLRADDEKLFPIYEAVIERKKAIIIHATSFPLPKDNLNVKHVERLLSLYPDLNVLIPHMGLYESEIYAELLCNYPRLYLDTAFVFNNIEKFPIPMDIVESMICCFSDRIIYGSDFPLLENDPFIGIRHICRFSLGYEIEHKIFWKNAHSFLNKALS